jgi:hypothetical protein
MHQIVAVPADTPVNSPVIALIAATEVLSLYQRCMLVDAFVSVAVHPLQISDTPAIGFTSASVVMVSVTLTAELAGAVHTASGSSTFANTHNTIFCVNCDTV